MRFTACFVLTCGGLLSTSSASAQCEGDFDGSGTVDVQDVLLVIAGWGNPYGVEDLLSTIGNWGCMTQRDNIGVFDQNRSYFELDIPGTEALKFHFGSQFPRWGTPVNAQGGDFNGDGFDTVCVMDMVDVSFLIADENDSDEFEDLGTKLFLTGLPPTPPQGDGPPVLHAIIGDWNGDGIDGIGIFITETNAFYLRDTLSTGPAEHVVVLDPMYGFPNPAHPITGDFDGDGDDELGLLSSDVGVVYLTSSLEANTVFTSFSIPGTLAVAGDYNGDGIDTMACFNATNNQFTIMESNSSESPTYNVSFGHGEPDFWTWTPLAGHWQVPSNPVAGQGYAWPEGDPAAHGVNPEALIAGFNNMQNIENVKSVLFIRNGTLLGEQYFHGYDRHIAQNIKSVSKSVLSSVFGVAYDQGQISSLNDPVSTYIPDYFKGLGEAKQSITIMDMMTMRGGLNCGPDPQVYNTGLRNADDYVEFVLEQDLVYTPGTVYDYSTGLTHLGSAMLEEAVGEPTRSYAREHIFEPLGISVPRWDGSPEGYDFGGAEMWLRPRDLARFGQLFLDDGMAGDVRLLSSLWVHESANPWVPESGGRTYGLWWRERPWNNYFFDDSYFGWGYGGQFVLLFPSWELVIVVSARWNVAADEASQVANEILNAVDQHLLTAIGD